MLHAALAYAARGFEVFPVGPDKMPLTWHGHKDASTDASVVRRWWKKHPDAQIATRCTWFWVLDIDPRKGGNVALRSWTRIGPLPRTWTARTGSQGLHYYFQHDERLETVPLGGLRAGVDIKGDGRGYVLLPPSRNKNGRYSWLLKPSESELAAAPEWLLQLVIDTKYKPAPQPMVRPISYDDDNRMARASAYCRRLEPAISGQGGHGATFRAACLISRGFALTEDEAYSVLLTEFNPRCDPPWSAAELRRKVREALRVGQIETGALLTETRRHGDG